MTSRLIALLILTVSILTACGRANASTHPATAGYLIFLEGGFSNAGEIVKVLDSGTGTVVRELPIGTPAADWSRYYVVTQLTGNAQLKAIDPASGRSSAPIRFNSVLLPDPEGPVSATKAPASNRIETPESAPMRPPSKVLLTSSTTTSAPLNAA